MTIPRAVTHTNGKDVLYHVASVAMEHDMR